MRELSEKERSLKREELMRLLNYDPETGEFTWKVSRTYNSLARAGNIAGIISTRGYKTILISGRRYYAHRLAWFYVHGKWPSITIDHINLNKVDNRIVNLREATRSQNQANRRGYGASGFKGAALRVKKTGIYYEASICVEGSHSYLGTFRSAEEAQAAYSKQASRSFGEFMRI